MRICISYSQDSISGHISLQFDGCEDEERPLLRVNNSEPSDEAIASGSAKEAKKQRRVHFSGTKEEDKASLPPSKDYDVG